MSALAMVVLFAAGTVFAVGQVARALLRGRIENFFSRRSRTLSVRDEPIRFVLSIGGWALCAAFAAFAAIASAPEVPRALWAFLPAAVGPVIATVLLVRSRAPQLAWPDDELIERALDEGARAIEPLPEGRTTRLLLAVARARTTEATYREGASTETTALERAAAAERRAIALGVLPVATVIIAPTAAIVLGFPMSERTSVLVATALLLMLSGLLVWRSLVRLRALSSLEAAIRARLR